MDEVKERAIQFRAKFSDLLDKRGKHVLTDKELTTAEKVGYMLCFSKLDFPDYPIDVRECGEALPILREVVEERISRLQEAGWELRA